MISQFSPLSGVQERAELAARTVFLGGPTEHFERVGRNQLIVLLRHGLQPTSKVLDIGCGALRGGYWLMRFLDPGCYFGIEPNVEAVRVGLEQVVEPEVVERSQPRFDHNDRFDLSVFGEKFDFFLARSVWTHASKPQIEAMLDGLLTTGTSDAVFLTSVVPMADDRPDYQGTEWVGRSHTSDEPGVVAHDASWISKACTQRGLTVGETGPNILSQQ